MITYIKTGVWMDHSNAHIISLANTVQMPQTIASGFTGRDKEKIPGQSKSTMLCLQQREQSAYHKNIAAALIESNEVFLFGPTDAKDDLYKMLREDHNFDAVTIEFYNSYKIIGSEDFELSENCFSGQGIEAL